MADGDNRRVGRRGFFAEAMSKMVRPLADFVEKRVPAAALYPSVEAPRHSVPRPRTLLRPPGAIAEAAFESTCHRCGQCADVCPARCITLLGAEHGTLAGTPAIDPDVAACVVCDGIKCTHVCPSGALLPIFDVSAMHMGLAVVEEALCLRSHNEPCTICVDKCPLGPAAIRFTTSGPPEVLDPGCTGCGICQLYCPTMPKAITIHNADTQKLGIAKPGNLGG